VERPRRRKRGEAVEAGWIRGNQKLGSLEKVGGGGRGGGGLRGGEEEVMMVMMEERRREEKGSGGEGLKRRSESQCQTDHRSDEDVSRQGWSDSSLSSDRETTAQVITVRRRDVSDKVAP